MSEPATIAEAVIAFEDHRTLEPALAATQDNLDALAVRDAAIDGMRLVIEHLGNCITGARDATSKGIYETKLAAAERQLAKVRGVDVAGLVALLRGGK